MSQENVKWSGACRKTGPSRLIAHGLPVGSYQLSHTREVNE